MGIDPEDVEINRIITIKAQSLAGKYGFTVQEQPDIEQELRMHLWERGNRLTPRSAKKTTVADVALQRAIANLIEARNAQKRDRRKERALDAAPQQSLIEDGNDIERLSTQMDVTEALESLPKHLLPVASELMKSTPAKAAEELGLTRGQLRHRMALIAKHFQSCGIFSDSRNHPANISCQ